MKNPEIEQFLTQAEKEANSLTDVSIRDKHLERVRKMWESYSGDDRIVTSHELAKAMEDEPEVLTMKSGWGGLDSYTGGFSYGQLIVLSAAEKSGKSTWALQMANQMKEHEPCCFLFEQSPREIIRQMKERKQDIPYFLTPLNNIDNSFSWLEKRMMEAMIKRGARLFVIDNFDWLEKEHSKNLRSDEIAKDILLRLKNFCTTWEVVIVLIAHVRKIPMQQIPQPDDIKDTAAFKQIADTVLILWRKVKEEKIDGTKTKAFYRTNETLLWVAENRRLGKTGYCQFVFNGNKFIEEVWDNMFDGEEGFANYDF